MATMQNNSDRTETDSLYVLARQCQDHYLAWQNAQTPDERDRLRREHRDLLEQLWQALASDLRKQARKWRKSGMAPDLDSLAIGMFVHIVAELPKLKLDPSRNVRSLLLTITWRRQVDENRNVYSHGPHSSYTNLKTEAPVQPDSSEGHLWNGSPATPEQSAPIPYDDLPDPASYEQELSFISRIDGQVLLEILWHYWHVQLSIHDLLIVELRWLTDPQLSFGAIAQQLGDGWMEATVRQRHYRIIKETRIYLQGQGFIEM